MSLIARLQKQPAGKALLGRNRDEDQKKEDHYNDLKATGALSTSGPS